VARPTQLSDHLVKTAFELGRYVNLSDIPAQRFCRIPDCIWDLIEATSLGKQSWDLLHLNRPPVARTPHGGRHILSHVHFMFLRVFAAVLDDRLGTKLPDLAVLWDCGFDLPYRHRLKLADHPNMRGENHCILILWVITEHILEYGTTRLMERFTLMSLNVTQLPKRQE
jgi:hypothetical protein